MPNRKRARKQRPRRRIQRAMLAEYNGRSIISPAASLIFGWNDLPEVCKRSAFVIKSITLEASAVDTATANKQTFGSALLQIRQLTPYASTDDTSATGLKSSKLFMVGQQPKTIHFKPVAMEYPEKYRGKACVSIDCICPREGWEIGALLVIRMVFDVKHPSTTEACKTTLATVPTKTISEHMQDWQHVDEISMTSSAFSPN